MHCLETSYSTQMGTLSWTDYRDLILTGYSSALSWTVDPGYTVSTTMLEWHITIADKRWVIKAPKLKFTGTKLHLQCYVQNSYLSLIHI